MSPLLRTGAKLGRTLYVQVGPEPSTADRVLGLVDTWEWAEYLAAAVNRATEAGLVGPPPPLPPSQTPRPHPRRVIPDAMERTGLVPPRVSAAAAADAAALAALVPPYQAPAADFGPPARGVLRSVRRLFRCR